MAVALNIQVNTILPDCDRVVDVAAGKYLPDRSILVEDNRIRAVGSRSEIEEELNGQEPDQTVGLNTCLPGLMDMHVHLIHENSSDHYLKRFIRSEADNTLKAAHFARITLAAGFTTVRDLGDGA